MLFVAGAISALPDMPLEVNILALVLFLSAVLGDSCNYMIGHFLEINFSIIPIPVYLSKVIWKKHMNFIKLNSTCKCNRILINNLFKFFVWREVSKSFTRSIIEFIFNPLNLFVGYFTKVLTLWDILPDKPVGVFIGTTFP